MRAMDVVIKQGKAFYWGTSEWSAGEILKADGIARQYGLTPPSMEQPQYNMFHRDIFEIEYDSIFKQLGYGTTIWSPLASGVLSGKYANGIPADSRAALPGFDWLQEHQITSERIEKVKHLSAIAADLGCTMSQLALAWCLMNPNVSTVITGASRPEQVVENMKAIDVEDKLTPEIMEKIELVLGNKPERYVA